MIWKESSEPLKLGMKHIYHVWHFFVKDMCRFCGTTITVSYFIYDNVFRIEEDNGRYMWSTDMITPLGDLYEAIQSRRHSSDSSMG